METKRTAKPTQLYKTKEECCACGACLNICQRQAIRMEEDAQGFLYPRIQEELCIHCGRCEKVCVYGSASLKQEVGQAYVSAAKDRDILMSSSSGGIFTLLAETIVEDGGAVYGAALVPAGDSIWPKHIRVTRRAEIEKLQGSKYVHSEIGFCLKRAEEDLLAGRPVLFSGTPCQIAGLKGYLGKDYPDLYTVDIICHGVPSARFFQDYLEERWGRKKRKILDFKFRDKKNGWGLNAKLIYRDKKGKIRSRYIPSGASSYYDLFLKSEIYRENCYLCPYAGKERVGDLTLGDYWGIQREHPELLKEAGGKYDTETGISCILVNNTKGKALLDKISGKVQMDRSTIEKAANENGQLKFPSSRPDTREQVLSLYRDGGYAAVEAYFRGRNGLRTAYCYLKNRVPRSLKNKIKKKLGR